MSFRPHKTHIYPIQRTSFFISELLPHCTVTVWEFFNLPVFVCSSTFHSGEYRVIATQLRSTMLLRWTSYDVEHCVRWECSATNCDLSHGWVCVCVCVCVCACAHVCVCSWSKQIAKWYTLNSKFSNELFDREWMWKLCLCVKLNRTFLWFLSCTAVFVASCQVV